MLKAIASFLLFIFLTQTVLAGIDMHNGLMSDGVIDIVEHYIDEHNTVPQCGLDLETDHKEMTSHSDNNSDTHQHSCHGHMTSFPFSEYALPNLDAILFHSTFFYVFTDHSTVLNTAYRPPIAS